MKTARFCLLLLAAVSLSACKGETPSSNNVQPSNQSPGGKKALIRVTSKAFQEGGMIPKQYTCDGPNISPPLAWSDVPEKTKSIALVAEDPDAPRGTWVHWVAFNIPQGTRELPENVPAQENISGGGRQGTNDFKKVGYGGPCPPSGGAHRYYFKLYALDAELTLDSSATKDQLLKAIDGHVLGEGQLMGKYQK
ncbi:MAG: YbhB/YbcL family Raf kinase inhibitor-like protein [Acidobacteriota bacterium]|nr:YbhB/YbcL family Raf kinase inhibitor-like protein [Acidobacteriota bacterium]